MAANVATISGENDKSSVVIFTSPCVGWNIDCCSSMCDSTCEYGKRYLFKF